MGDAKRRKAELAKQRKEIEKQAALRKQQRAIAANNQLCGEGRPVEKKIDGPENVKAKEEEEARIEAERIAALEAERQAAEQAAAQAAQFEAAAEKTRDVAERTNAQLKTD